VAQPLTAHGDGFELSGSLWVPDDPPVALVVMHPGSGPSDRHNDVYFPPIRAALLAAGVAVASFDKRGVGGSGGSWLEAGVEQQADDLIAALAVARAQLPGVPAGVFGHSQGGWVVLAAAARSGAVTPAFAVTSSGPAVTMGAQERYATGRMLERRGVTDEERARVEAATDAFFALAERGATYDELLAWAAQPAAADEVALVVGLFGEALPPREEWDLVVRLAGFDPVPALRAIRVPLLAVFGAEDAVTPVAASVAAVRAEVDPALLTLAVLGGGDHRLGFPDLVPGFPDAVVDFVVAQAAA
jgi:uncharacterized protein